MNSYTKPLLPKKPLTSTDMTIDQIIIFLQQGMKKTTSYPQRKIPGSQVAHLVRSLEKLSVHEKNLMNQINKLRHNESLYTSSNQFQSDITEEKGMMKSQEYQYRPEPLLKNITSENNMANNNKQIKNSSKQKENEHNSKRKLDQHSRSQSIQSQKTQKTQKKQKESSSNSKTKLGNKPNIPISIHASIPSSSVSQSQIVKLDERLIGYYKYLMVNNKKSEGLSVIEAKRQQINKIAKIQMKILDLFLDQNKQQVQIYNKLSQIIGNQTLISNPTTLTTQILDQITKIHNYIAKQNIQIHNNNSPNLRNLISEYKKIHIKNKNTIKQFQEKEKLGYHYNNYVNTGRTNNTLNRSAQKPSTMTIASHPPSSPSPSTVNIPRPSTPYYIQSNQSPQTPKKTIPNFQPKLQRSSSLQKLQSSVAFDKTLFTQLSSDNIIIGSGQESSEMQGSSYSINSQINSNQSYNSSKQKQCVQFFSQYYPLPKQSQAIIFIKQVYAKLYYKTNKNPWFPSIKNMQIHLFNKKQADQKGSSFTSSNSTNNSIYKNRIIITIIGDSQSNNPNPNLKGHSKIQIQLYTYNKELPVIQKNLTYKTIPNSIHNSTKAARQLLQKKIWIKLSQSLDEISFHFGDLTSADVDAKDVLKTKLGMKVREGWDNQAEIFDSGKFIEGEEQEELAFHNLDTFCLFFSLEDKTTVQSQLLKRYNQFHKNVCIDFIKQYFIITAQELTRLQGPVLSTSPSVLTDHANIHILGKEINILYEYLKDLSITHLPKFTSKLSAKNNIDLDEYYNWRNLRAAIDKSIKTQPGYLCYQINGKKYQQPLGILNMCLQVKTIDLAALNIKGRFKFTQFKWDKQRVKENMDQIYKKRKVYIRFQLTQKEGISPGGMGVLQIWPPYCCSPIHNHGQAFGLIKVLANQICVQNYRDLNFIDEDQIPYQTNIYQQGQYTWLSNFSYGVHRLINTTSHTAINLQAYLNGNSSHEHFKLIIDKKTSSATYKRQYAEYSPQNDWKNFLKWPQKLTQHLSKQQSVQTNIDNPHSHNQQQYRDFHQISIYIQKMKEYYNIQYGNFQQFVLAMKREYEFCDFIGKYVGEGGKAYWKKLVLDD